MELDLYVVTIIDISDSIYNFVVASTDEYISRDVKYLAKDNAISEVAVIKTSKVHRAVRPLTNESFKLIIEKEN